ncbi:MAG: transposase family protein [Richelia sp. SM2_1_7]|nr:transposase family protein [Richelia sp. SM2_1_7]
MERICIDTMGPFPEADGYQHILVIIDAFIRFVDLYPIKLLDGKEAAHTLLQYIGRFGTPYQIMSDKGPQFVNEVVETLCNTLLKNEKIEGHLYSKQENGIVERMNKEILKHLRALMMVIKQFDLWPQYLPLVQRIINATPHSAIGVSPAQLLFGNAIHLDKSLVQFAEHSKNIPSYEPPQNCREWVDKMLSVQSFLIRTAQDRQKERCEAFGTK